MPEQVSPRTRARDIDRAQTCGLLDAGYGEGQLDPTEYEARTTAAMKAKTLGELDALVSDLQIPDHLVEAARASAAAPRRRVPARGVAAGVAAAAVIVGIVVLVTREDEPAPEPAEVVAAQQAPAPAPIPAGEPQPMVIEPIDTATADGIAEFLRLFQAKFGDQVVDDLYLEQRHASFQRMLPEQPHRVQRWDFYRGFDPSGSPSSRSSDTATVDLAGIEIDRLGDLIREAPSLVGLPAGRIDYIIVRPDPITAEPEIGIYVEDPALRSGYLYATFDGRVTHTSAPTPEGG
ncbi:DUF1707 domain-containing protein [Prescottella agglutinans]|uniref:DUF1707 domain-containing protein n=1 Tax=Prescottella agglutinans TaxID=1644129 RepID=A0A438B9K7_9NOCA|nr:DUF1707 domain-containing protein [Prescottella agglutinans]RVW07650.1 DUF1707 domain-containing protein [Prescottella agglutinans]